MSLHLYLQCESHEPPLKARNESGQHRTDLEMIRHDIRDRDVLVRLYWANAISTSAHFRWTSAQFLAEHEGCKIGIVAETGEEFPVDPEEGQ